MSIDKTTRSNGESPKAQRASRSRKNTSPESLDANSTDAARGEDDPTPEEITSGVENPDNNTNLPGNDLSPEPLTPDSLAQDALTEMDAHLPGDNLNPEPMTPVSAAKDSPAEASQDHAPADDNNVDNSEGEMMTSNQEQTPALSPTPEGQLVQATGGGLVPKVASTMTIAGGQRPIMTSNLQVTQMMGNRPIFASDLQIYETINVSGLRPVLVSPFQIVGSLDAAGHRPIGANEFDVVGTINVSGIRPIGVSTLHITEMLTASRPIASNDIDDSPALMGFID